jgi:hypothetical protein
MSPGVYSGMGLKDAKNGLENDFGEDSRFFTK